MRVMSCITHFVVLHGILWRSQMLLTFSRHQMMHNVSCVVSYTESTCKGYFAVQ